MIADSDTGAFSRRGIIRAHWDCWDRCNLDCPFCFRSRGAPLGTPDARRALQMLGRGGISQLALTGGDPSLRDDLAEIVASAHDLGMQVEVLTNAHRQSETVVEAVLSADLVGLSLDGSSAKRHDAFRARAGNFARVIALMDRLDASGRPYVVRTVIARTNSADVSAIGDVLRDRHGLVRWGLQQFSPVEQGLNVREEYELDAESFEQVCADVLERHGDALREITTLADDAKTGLYLILNPAGDVFGRQSNPVDGRHRTIGNILEGNLSALAAAVEFDPARHQARYSDWFDEA